MSLTGIVAAKTAPSCRDGPLAKNIDKTGVLAAWAQTAWAKKLANRTTRANLSDFQRFQVKTHKQKRNRIVRTEFRKLKKSA
jgi:large subunit ribosomal protein L14e